MNFRRQVQGMQLLFHFHPFYHWEHLEIIHWFPWRRLFVRKKYSIRKQQLVVVQDVANWKENNTSKSDNSSNLKKFNSFSLKFKWSFYFSFLIYLVTRTNNTDSFSSEALFLPQTRLRDDLSLDCSHNPPTLHDFCCITPSCSQHPVYLVLTERPAVTWT